MPSIDERVVSMAFENAKFEAGVAQTMASLGKLDAAIKSIGSTNGLDNIEKAANKVTLQQPMSALDKLKARFSRAGEGSAAGFNEIEKAGNKVTLEQPVRALNKVQSATAQVGAGAAQGFSDIEKASDRVSLGGFHRAINGVVSQLNVLEVAAGTVLGNIASKAAAKGAGFAKSFGIGPILQGLNEYQTNLKAIQTIQANTDRPLTEINQSLQDLNHYSDQTIYNFSEMARNIGTFTAAGVELKTATSSIKGIANMAALSGSTSQQAATAMYQLSQAISSGRVGLQDWNSVVNAGMGGKKLQTALGTTAVAMGKLGANDMKISSDGLKKLTINGKSFRESIMAKPGQTSWLTGDILVNTLATLDGRFSRVALSTEKTKDGLQKYTKAQVEAKIVESRASLEKKNGVKYTDEQFKSLMKLSDAAFKSATEVKTLGQVFDVAKETIGSGWSASFQSIFGNLTEAKKTFTSLSNAVNGFINANALARNTVLHDWKQLGGRTALIEGIKNAFKALFGILKPIGQAFRDIFPRKTGADLAEMTKNFAAFTAKLKPSESTIDGIRRTFRGLFAVLHIGWSIVKGVIGVFGDLLGTVGQGSGGFLNFTGSIGDFLVAVDTALTKGGLLTSFFDTIAKVLKVPLQLFMGIASAIFGLFGGADSGGADKVTGSMDKVSKAAGPLANALDKIKGAWEGFVHMMGEAKDLVSPWLDKIGEQLSRIGGTISEAFQGENFDHLMTTLQTGFIGGIFLAIKKALGGFGTNALGPVKAVLGQLTNNLKTMQQSVKAKIILEIAAAIGILAAATYVLSTIDAKDLAKSMAAIAIGLGQLMGAMKLMSGGMGKLALASMPVIAASLIGLAFAMVILAGAMKIFATMSWEELVKGLIGVGGGLAAIGIGMKAASGLNPIQAASVMLMALALNALALAVKLFASLSWEELGRGLAGVLGVLVALIAPITAAGPMLLPAAAGLVGIAFAMNLLAGAVGAFSMIDPGKMAIGIGGIALSLVALSAATWAFPPTLPLTAAGLVILGVALSGIAGAIAMFGKIDVANMAKGLIGMGAALLILAVGVTAMSGTAMGAVALLATAAALAILAPTLGFLGTLNWGTIFKGLAAMALVLGVLSVVGLVASEGLISLGVSLLPLAGVLLITAGAVFLFSKALALLGDEGTKGIGVMVAAITAFIAILPKIVIDFAKGLVGIYEEVAKIAPKVVEALIKILDSVIEVIIRSAPRLAIAAGSLIDAFLLVIGQKAGPIIAAGWKLLLDFLKGIDDNIGQVISRVGNIIAQFVNGLASQAPKLTTAGAKFLIAFLNGIAANISRVVQAGYKIILGVIDGVARSIPKMIALGVRAIVGFLNGLATGIPRVIRAGVRVVTNTLDGISSQFGKVAATATRFVVRFFEAFGNRKNTAKMVDSGIKAAIHVLQGISDGIRKDENLTQVIDAAVDIGVAIVEGVGKGLLGLPKKLAGKLLGPVQGAVNKTKGWLHIKSPSRVFVDIGQNIVDGLGIGLIGMPGVLNAGILSPLAQMLKETKGAREIGKFLGTEFREGLTGGLWDKNNGKSQAVVQIEDTFKALQTKLSEERAKLQDKVKQDQSKFDELLAADKPNTAKIQKAYDALTRSRTALVLSSSSSSMLMKSLQDEKSALTKLANEYDLVTKQLEKAQEVFNQFNVLPDFTKLVDDAVAEAAMTGTERWEALRKEQEAKDARNRVNQVALYKQSLQEQIAATTKYMETLQKLREAGLDDATYQKLLSQGTAGQEFASQLLSSGKGGIESINKLDSQLAAASSKVAENAAKALVKAGDQAAQGLITGLQNRQNEIRKTMEDIAKTMIKSIKTQLMIRSPSRIFAEIGQFSVRGLADGLKASSNLVRDAAAGVGDEAASALSKSLANISDRVQNDIDTDLTITPVLDLTQVQKDANKIQDLTNVTPITAAASYGQASAISQTAQETAAAQPDRDVQKILEVNFEQTNTSPKALDDIEIYRKTNNQLSQVKSVLGLVS